MTTNFPAYQHSSGEADSDVLLTEEWIEEEYNLARRMTPLMEDEWRGYLVTELAHWAEYGITTRGQLQHYLVSSEFSDLYKSLNGFRPRWETDYAFMKAFLERDHSEEFRRMAESSAEQDRIDLEYNMTPEEKDRLYRDPKYTYKPLGQGLCLSI